MKPQRIISLLTAICLSVSYFMTPCILAVADTYSSAEYVNLIPVADSDPASIQHYKDYIYYDPQWVSDEAMFGVWNGTKWLPQTIQNGTASGGTTVIDGPLLKYDLAKYSDTLRPIEAAAKKGDYDTCKKLLLEHYKNKYSKQSKPSGSDSRQNEINSQTVFYNLAGYSNGTDAPVEILEMGTSGWSSVNITNTVKSIASSGNSSKGLLALFVALKRDGVQASISSKESSNPAYIEVTMSNGSIKKFTAVFDASVRAGNNSSRRYGSATVVHVEESLSSVSRAENVDEYTKRGYIRFDMDTLSASDSIKSARLYVHGTTNSADSSYKKPIVIYQLGYDKTFSESNFCWDSTEHYVMSDDKEDTYGYSDTKFAGSGFVDTVYRSPARISGAVASCISMYTATGDEEYAYHAIRTIIGLYMKRGMIGNPSDSGAYWPYTTKLCLGNRALQYQNRLKALINSKYMTPEVFACMIKLAWITGEQLEYCWGTQETTTNWGNTEASALFNMALYFDEFEDSHKPLSDYEYQTGSKGKSGGWNELAVYRLLLKSDEILFSDGSSPEIPMGYVDYALNSLVNAYKMGVNADMEEDIPPSLKDSIEKIIEYLIYMSAPDGSGWSQGNGNEHSDKTIPYSRASWFKNKSDNALINWYGAGRSGTAPAVTSKIYPTGLKYISRGSWKTNAVGSQFNADGGCNVHGHGDDLSFNVAAYGEHLLVDNGVIDYTDNATRAWQISTRAHNTIEINDVSQKTPKWTLSSVHNDPFGGEKIFLPDYDNITADSQGRKLTPGYFMNTELNNSYDYVRGGTNNNKGRRIDEKKLSWNDYTYERSIYFVRPDFYLVTDYLDPLTNKNEINTYRQYWHTLPDNDISIDSATGTAKIIGKKASVLVTPVQQKDPLTAATGKGFYSAQEGYVSEAEYAVYTKKVSGTTTMNTVIYPVASNENVDITTSNIPLSVPESTASAFSATIKDSSNNTTETITKYEKHSGRGIPEQQSFGDFSTDGYLAVVEENGSTLEGVSLQGGTNFSDSDGNLLIYSENVIEGLHISWENGKIALDTGKTVVYDKSVIDTASEIDLYKLTIFKPDDVDVVTLNGKEIPYNSTANYIYFGNTPIVEDTQNVYPSGRILEQNWQHVQSKTFDNASTGIDLPSIDGMKAEYNDGALVLTAEQDMSNGKNVDIYIPKRTTGNYYVEMLMKQSLSGNDSFRSYWLGNAQSNSALMLTHGATELGGKYNNGIWLADKKKNIPIENNVWIRLGVEVNFDTSSLKIFVNGTEWLGYEAETLASEMLCDRIRISTQNTKKGDSITVSALKVWMSEKGSLPTPTLSPTPTPTQTPMPSPSPTEIPKDEVEALTVELNDDALIDGDNIIKTTIISDDVSEQEVAVIAALYDQNTGECMGCKLAEPGELSLKYNTSSYSNYIMKVFVWNSVNSMIPHIASAEFHK